MRLISLLVLAVVLDMVLQEDVKIWIGGAFGTVNGVSRRGIARLHSGGALDSTLLAGGTDGNVFALALDDTPALCARRS